MAGEYFITYNEYDDSNVKSYENQKLTAKVLLELKALDQKMFESKSKDGFAYFKFYFKHVVDGKEEKFRIDIGDGKAINDEYFDFLRKELADEKTVAQKSMHDYGYKWEGMIPLSAEKAEEMFNEGGSVFKLYSDGTEAEVENIEELRNHRDSGMFGVERLEKEKEIKKTYIKNPSKEQRQEWKKAADEKKTEYENTLKDIVNNYKENPEEIAEFLKWSATFHPYSAKNMMLIRAQNEEAMFCRSFGDWKKEGYSVNKGEKGLGIFVPVTKTILETERGRIPLSTATKEEKAAYKSGKIKGDSYLNFKIGTVFDVTQTNFPPEDYPKLIEIGGESLPHKKMYEALKNYADENLGCEVTEKDFMAAAHRGSYCPDDHTIVINEILKDTEKLSTLTHEIGHAIMHNKDVDYSPARVELEADAISIMLQSKLGVTLTDSRKRHLKEHFQVYEKEMQIEENKQLNLDGILQNVFDEYEELSHSIDEQIEKGANKELEAGIRPAEIQQSPKRKKEKAIEAEL
jgi:hypothetical protein